MTMAASRMWNLLLLCLLNVQTNLGKQMYKHFSTTSTQENAKTDCGEGYTLPLYQTAAERSEVNKALNNEKIHEIWLPYKRRNLLIWTWIDDKPADQAIVKSTWAPGRHCCVFHLRDTVIEADNCSKAEFGYFCSGNKTCNSDDLISRACVNVAGQTYLYGCDVQNWYEARARCRLPGMDLAIVKPEHYETLKTEWFTRERKKCMDVWIGLFKEKWEAGDSGDLLVYLWGRGQPSVTGDCSLLTKNEQGRVYWRAESCSAKHHRLCFPEESSFLETTTTESGLTTGTSLDIQRAKEHKISNRNECFNVHFRNATIVFSFMSVLLLIIVIWLSIKLQQKHKKHAGKGLFVSFKRPHRRYKPHDEEPRHPEQRPLTGGSSNFQGVTDSTYEPTASSSKQAADAIPANTETQPTYGGDTPATGKKGFICTEQGNNDRIVALPEPGKPFWERPNVCRTVSMYIVDADAGFDITFFVTNSENAHESVERWEQCFQTNPEILFPVFGHGTIIPTYISIPNTYKIKTTLQARVKSDFEEWEVHGPELVNIDLSEIENVLQDKKFDTLITINVKRAANSDVSGQTPPDIVLSPTFTILEDGFDLARGRIRVNMAKVQQSTEQDKRACGDDDCCSGSGRSNVLPPERTVRVEKTRGARPVGSSKESTSSGSRPDEQRVSDGGSSSTGVEGENNRDGNNEEGS